MELQGGAGWGFGVKGKEGGDMLNSEPQGGVTEASESSRNISALHYLFSTSPKNWLSFPRAKDDIQLRFIFHILEKKISVISS